MRLKGLHDIKTSTGGSRVPGINISIGGFGLARVHRPSESFKPKPIPAKAKKKRILNIRLFPEEGGLLGMHIEEE